MEMFDGKIGTMLALKVALDDEDRAKVGAIVADAGRLRLAIDAFFATGWDGPEKAFEPCCKSYGTKCGPCSLYWATRPSSPSGSDPK